jgi:hypothetical protein
MSVDVDISASVFGFLCFGARKSLWRARKCLVRLVSLVETEAGRGVGELTRVGFLHFNEEIRLLRTRRTR